MGAKVMANILAPLCAALGFLNFSTCQN